MSTTGGIHPRELGRELKWEVRFDEESPLFSGHASVSRPNTTERHARVFMTGLGELDRLTDEETADLHRRVEQFVAVWKSDGSAGVARFLPPRGARHRTRVLVQIILRDMECRAALGLPFRVERYVNELPDDLNTQAMPVELLVAEYQLRHRYTDKPPLEEYHRWFPEQFDALLRRLQHDSGLVAATGGGHASPTPLAPPLLKPTIPTQINTLNDGRRASEAAVGATRLSMRAAERDPAASALPSSLLPGDAPYQLVRKLGSGAFGEVFEALAPGGIKVAVKRILRTLDHPASVSELEALEAIKQLSHPFLLKTNAYWAFEDKLVIVMELADGSLKDRIEHHQSSGLPGVPPEELVPFFEQASEALDYLHSQNISHRDIKPENLLILKGYAKVADFGLARAHEHHLTQVETTAGTPAYMAPEMWLQRVSLQSDQYSLAATYVRARLGRHLYDTNVYVEMANLHINGTPNLAPLPEAEQAVLLKALAKEPGQRYPSCAAFAQALRDAVFPPPAPVPVRESREPGRGNSILGTLTIALTCAIACALAVGLMFRFFIHPAAPVPTEQTKTQGDEKKGDEKKDSSPITPLLPLVQYPKGWSGVEEPDGIVTLGSKRYHKRIVRLEAGGQIFALLVEKKNASDPDTFYMLEYKVTNKVFASVWPTVDQSLLGALHKRNFILGRWRKDAEGRDLQIDGSDGSLPVLGVTVPEATLVAMKLEGSLPTFRQWTKAAGLSEGDVTVGPAGPPLTEEEEALPLEKQRAIFAKRHLALGLDSPLPVQDERASGDISKPWKIRQLVSNGCEWLCEDRAKRVVTADPPPLLGTYARVVGCKWSESAVFSPSLLREKVSEVLIEQVTGDGYAGFRIVLKPE